MYNIKHDVHPADSSINCCSKSSKNESEFDEEKSSGRMAGRGIESKNETLIKRTKLVTTKTATTAASKKTITITKKKYCLSYY